MLLAPSTILVWAASEEHGREVGITCDLIHDADGAPTYHATATSGVGYRLAHDDAAALLRIVTPALDAPVHPVSPPPPRRSLATD